MSGKWNGKRIFHIFVLVLAGIALMDLLFLQGGDRQEDGESGNGFSRRKKYVYEENHITHKNAYTGHTELHSGISANKC